MVTKKEKVVVSAEETQTAEADADLTAKKDSMMTNIVAQSANPPAINDVVEGPVIAISRGKVYIDIAHSELVLSTDVNTTKHEILSRR